MKTDWALLRGGRPVLRARWGPGAVSVLGWCQSWGRRPVLRGSVRLGPGGCGQSWGWCQSWGRPVLGGRPVLVGGQVSGGGKVQGGSVSVPCKVSVLGWASPGAVSVLGAVCQSWVGCQSSGGVCQSRGRKSVLRGRKLCPGGGGQSWGCAWGLGWGGQSPGLGWPRGRCQVLRGRHQSWGCASPGGGVSPGKAVLRGRHGSLG